MEAELTEAHGWVWFVTTFAAWALGTVHAAVIGSLTVKRSRQVDPTRSAVPGYVIAMLPGVTTYLTQVIVADRAHHGPYASVEHMVARQVITPKLAGRLRGV